MALAASTVYEINSLATAGNVNGAGFNPANAGMLTDLTTDAATANTAAPIVSSVSYAFAAGDVGHWLYIKTGTNWIAGWYKIMSVAGGKATLSAAIGSANVRIVTGGVGGTYGANTALGCATVDTPTAGTFTIDYSQGTAAIINPTDLASAGASTTLTSASAPFTPVMVGNLLHQTTTGVGGFGLAQWFEIATFVDASTVTTDRTTNNGTAQVGVTGYLGGAASLGAADDDAVFELAASSTTVSSRFFIKGGSSVTYTLGGTVSWADAGTIQFPIVTESYATSRGDRPTGATRPTINSGAASFTNSQNYRRYIGLIFTSAVASAATFTLNGINSEVTNCKFVNTSETASSHAVLNGGAGNTFRNCEFISLRGTGLQSTAIQVAAIGCYAHDCGISGILCGTDGASGNYLLSNLVCHNRVSAIDHTNSSISLSIIMGNTLYGGVDKIGIGLNVATGNANIEFLNNIIYGFATGVTAADTKAGATDDYNDYFNNTNDVSAATQWQKGTHDIAVDPVFSGLVERTGSTATTTAGNHLVQAGATFVTWGIAAGDYVLLSSGTGTTAGMYTVLTVDSETQLTTVQTLAANATANKVWSILKTTDFKVGTALKGTGTPGLFQGSSTTSYVDIGGVQRQEAGGGSFTFAG